MGIKIPRKIPKRVPVSSVLRGFVKIKSNQSAFLTWVNAHRKLELSGSEQTAVSYAELGGSGYCYKQNGRACTHYNNLRIRYMVDYTRELAQLKLDDEYRQSIEEIDDGFYFQKK